MRILNYILISFLFGVLGTVNISTAQSSLLNKNECFTVSTDKPYYFANQVVNFTAINCSDKEFIHPLWSKVLYAEIITPGGLPVYQGKFVTTPEGAEGQFIIPTGVPTGVYYFRAYTKWMRNFPTSQFAYKPITIINPDSEEILEDTRIDTDSLIQTDKERSKGIYLSFSSSKLSTRSKGTFTIQSDNLINKLSLVVRSARSNPIRDSSFQTSQNIQSRAKFIPETRGISLSGKVINAIDSTPLSNQVVNLSLFHNKRENLGSISDENGNFYFTLPQLYGENEVFISVQNTRESIKPLIQVDSDFCTSPVDLPRLKLAMPDNVLAEIQNNLKAQQVEQEYQGGLSYRNIKIDSSQIRTSFFGEPSIHVEFDEYIELPTIEDYITEVVPSTFINYVKKKPILRIDGLYQEMRIYEPLILVDMVKLPNIEPVLNISPRKIKHIDVVPKPYIIGNYTYAGIISFITKNNDLGGIDLPESGKFFSFDLFEKEIEIKNIETTSTHIPDCRTQLYWNANLSFAKGETKTISFTTGDIKGTFEIIAEGLDVYNNPVYYRHVFEVK